MDEPINIPNKVAVFVDVQNLYHAAKTFGNNSKVNYKMLLTKILNGRPAGLCRAYAAHKDLSGSKRFYKSLESSGFSVIAKRIHTKTATVNGREVRTSIPQYFEVEVATDVMEAIMDDSSISTVVLCTGNGAYSYLVDRLKEFDINVEVWGFAPATSSTIREKVKFTEMPAECLMTIKAEVEEEVPVVTAAVGV